MNCGVSPARGAGDTPQTADSPHPPAEVGVQVLLSGAGLQVLLSGAGVQVLLSGAGVQVLLTGACEANYQPMFGPATCLTYRPRMSAAAPSPFSSLKPMASGLELQFLSAVQVSTTVAHTSW